MAEVLPERIQASSSQSTAPSIPPPLIFDNDYPDIPNVLSPNGGDDSPSSSEFAKLKGHESISSDGHPLDTVIPHEHDHRTLVLCFDGTGDQFDGDNSNIVQFFSMLKKDDMSQQMVYYQAGIGTYTVPQIATPFMASVSKTLDMMIGIHLNAHVMGGYEFLMQNYQAGDKICIFGFSRGAYTARALAGMLYKVGLLPVCNHQQVPFAYHMYCQDDKAGWTQSTAFKKTFSINVKVEFLGVWDTVSAVGFLPRRLPFTKATTNVGFFRQAVSLDEHRVRFKPVNWTWPKGEKDLGVPDHEMPRSRKKHRDGSLIALEREHTMWDERTTDVEEVWFAGCHCDVGGGSVKNGTRNSLARIPLRWMIRECFKAKSGILFHGEMFKSIGLDPDSVFPEVKERPPPIFQDPSIPRTRAPNDPRYDTSEAKEFVSEEEEDLADVLSPIYDQLVLAKGWWFLEMTPQKQHYQREEGTSWVEDWTINMGSGRHVRRQKKDGVKIHRSVKIRMEADGLLGGKYWPKAKLKVEPKWVG
ncbi:hypothetical protein BJ138DRAFT_1006185 [Hygrophoropsis aurantiaca]|uniref:Uncharacterized protein n=1 Tax=Hygrophoropsis aurantiaca TaxID=72124 RepID=A0ACB8AFW2_9AGAM|nr:hypothetical protein BJ138DRAFT_1006185 [Hygrophoropsis aurantiaca]